MRFLLDTCALSELRREGCNPAARKLVDSAQDDDLFISVITLAELQKGISLLEPGKKKQDLETWLNALEGHYGDRILPVSREAARIWGEIAARCQQKWIALSAGDGLIAATALEHGLHVLTRNGRDFEPTGAMVSNPWES